MAFAETVREEHAQIGQIKLRQALQKVDVDAALVEFQLRFGKSAEREAKPIASAPEFDWSSWPVGSSRVRHLRPIPQAHDTQDESVL